MPIYQTIHAVLYVTFLVLDGMFWPIQQGIWIQRAQIP